MFTRPVIFSVSLLVGLLFPLAAVPADESKKYLCIAEWAAGFVWSESDDEWRADSGAYDTKYILKPLGDDALSNNPYGVFEFDSSHPNVANYECDESVSDVLEQGTGPAHTLYCSHGLGEFHFNPSTMRFQKYYPVGYVSGEDNNNDTPYMVIGKCSPL